MGNNANRNIVPRHTRGVRARYHGRLKMRVAQSPSDVETQLAPLVVRAVLAQEG